MQQIRGYLREIRLGYALISLQEANTKQANKAIGGLEELDSVDASVSDFNISEGLDLDEFLSSSHEGYLTRTVSRYGAMVGLSKSSLDGFGDRIDRVLSRFAFLLSHQPVLTIHHAPRRFVARPRYVRVSSVSQHSSFSVIQYHNKSCLLGTCIWSARTASRWSNNLGL